MEEAEGEETLDRKSFSDLVVQYERDLLDPGVDRFTKMIDVIDQLREHCKHHGLVSSGNNLALVEHWYTRLATAISSWALHPDEVLNPAKLEELVRRKNEIVYIFAASGFRNMTHLISQLSKSREKGKLQIDGKKSLFCSVSWVWMI